jgi:hypothetical protein
MARGGAATDDLTECGNRRKRPTPVVQEVRGVAKKKTASSARGVGYVPSFPAMRAGRQPDKREMNRRFQTLVALKKR